FLRFRQRTSRLNLLLPLRTQRLDGVSILRHPVPAALLRFSSFGRLALNSAPFLCDLALLLVEQFQNLALSARVCLSILLFQRAPFRCVRLCCEHAFGNRGWCDGLPEQRRDRRGSARQSSRRRSGHLDQRAIFTALDGLRRLRG